MADKLNFISDRGWRVRTSTFAEFPVGEAFELKENGAKFVLDPKKPAQWPAELHGLEFTYVEGDELVNNPPGFPDQGQFETAVATKQRLECQVELQQQMHDLRIWVVTRHKPQGTVIHKRVIVGMHHSDGAPVHPGHVHADD